MALWASATKGMQMILHKNTRFEILMASTTVMGLA
jgi:hypothetical protein